MLTIIENSSGIETRNDEIRKELEAIAARKCGLNPTTLLSVAKNPKSCLHNLFTWDDTEAARKYREMQAYEVIRRVKVTIMTNEDRQVTVRAFWPVKQVEKDGTIDASKRGNYMPIADVMDEEEALRQTIQNAKGELAAFSTKYSVLSTLADMAGLFSEIRKVTSR